jgi:hypothetical protein
MWAAKVTGWELACRKARFWKGLVLLHNQKGFEHFFRRVELHRQRLERPVEVAMEGYNGQRSFAGVGRSWPDPPRNRPDAPRTNGAVPPGKSPSRPG